MKINSNHNQRPGIAVAGIVLALLVANFRPVQAMFVDMHILVSLWRFEREVLQASPAGQYFDGLAWIHIFEGLRILRDHPEHIDEIHSLAYLTLPHLDSLLDGKGDTAIITEQQVRAVETEVNWWMSVASPSLQSDIQSTLELYPLDQFAGMTMNEAVDHVNSTLIETQEQPGIVNGTNGQWAYYMYEGVYFEYPSSWYLKVQEDSYGNGYLLLIPSAESNGAWNVGVTTLEAWEIVPDPTQPFDLHCEIDYVNAEWEESVLVDGMEGYYFIYDPSRTGMFRKLESILYNQDKKIKVRVTVSLFSVDEIFFDRNVNEAKKTYEYLFHITESVRFH